MPTSTLAQANKANHAAKADYEILVTLDDQQEYITAQFPSPVKLGKTVICRAAGDKGLAEIYFDVDGSPFLNIDTSQKTEIDSNDPPLELKVPSPPTGFTGRCYLKTSDGAVHTYDPAARLPGGDMIVR
jgi:hypothetical protein